MTMADKIEPALTEEQWKQARYYHDHGQQLDTCEGERDDVRAYLIALNNDALPDTDDRKITRKKVAALRDVLLAMSVNDHWYPGEQVVAFVDALESYLPPVNDT